MVPGLFKQPSLRKAKLEENFIVSFLVVLALEEKNGIRTLYEFGVRREPADLESPVGKAQSLAPKTLQLILTRLGLRTIVYDNYETGVYNIGKFL